ncbi:MAG: Gfo/Idh/MocA family oxidoreductase [Pyrinomonadaceae bacterium]
MIDKFKFAIIGTGAIAQTYAQAFEICASAHVVAVADVRADAANAYAERLKCRSYTSHEELTRAEKEIDAVIICTPPALHREIAIHFLEHKIHVLCEKPLCLDVPSAKEMIAVADSSGVLLTMASKFRYVTDVICAKSLVTSGALGDVILFENAFTSNVDMSERWNARRELSGGGVLIDNGTHSVDIMRYFLGALRDVQVIEGKRSQNLEVEETVRLFARSLGNVLGCVDLSWSINKNLDNYINIYGTQGSISVGWKESKFIQTNQREWTIFGHGYDKVQAFCSQIDNFVKAIRGEEQLLINAADALASVEAIEATYIALEHNQWTTVRTC